MNYLTTAVLGLLTAIILNTISQKKLHYEISKRAKIASAVLEMALWIVFQFKYGFSLQMGLLGITGSVLIESSFIDIKYREIPNLYNFMIFLLGLGYISLHGTQYLNLLGGGILGFVTLLFLAMIMGGIGAGDIKFVGGFGLFIGFFAVLNYLFLASFLGVIYGIYLMIFQKKGIQYKLQFAPFLTIAGICYFVLWI